MSRERTSCSNAAWPAHCCRKNSSRLPAGSCKADCNKSSIFLQRSGSILTFTFHFAVKPGPCSTPVAQHRYGRDLEELCCFVHAQPSEKPKLHDLCLAGIETGQRF